MITKEERNLKYEYLIEQLDYNKDTGEFYWKVKRQGRKIDKPIGSPSRYGVLVIRLDDYLFRCDRLAWYYHYGVWPKQVLKHKDDNLSNNAISNLEEVSYFEQDRIKKIRRDKIKWSNLR